MTTTDFLRDTAADLSQRVRALPLDSLSLDRLPVEKLPIDVDDVDAIRGRVADRLTDIWSTLTDTVTARLPRERRRRARRRTTFLTVLALVGIGAVIAIVVTRRRSGTAGGRDDAEWSRSDRTGGVVEPGVLPQEDQSLGADRPGSVLRDDDLGRPLVR
jgi:hypothetical protein